jgi:hypothetical protein
MGRIRDLSGVAAHAFRASATPIKLGGIDSSGAWPRRSLAKGGGARRLGGLEGGQRSTGGPWRDGRVPASTGALADDAGQIDAA